MTRRRTLEKCGWLLAAAPLARGQQLAGEPPGRIAPVEELVNAFEFEEELNKAGGVGAVHRTTEEWLSHPEGMHLAKTPVVEIVKQSLKVQSPDGVIRSYNAPILRKLYGQP